MSIEHDRWQDAEIDRLNDRVSALEARLDNLLKILWRLTWGRHEETDLLKRDEKLKGGTPK